MVEAGFVPRAELLEQLLAAEAGTVWEVRGAAGVGKSVLLTQLGRVVAANGGAVAVIDVGETSTGFESADDDVAQTRWFERTVAVLLQRLGLPGFQADGGTVRELIREVRGSVSERAVGRDVLVLVDSFELAAEQRVGDWLLDLLTGLPTLVAVVARRLEGPGEPLLGADHVLEVGHLTGRQVADYLSARFGTRLGGLLADKVAEFTGGRALAVGIAADLIDERRRLTPGASADLIVQDLRPLGTDDPGARLATLVDALCRTATGDALLTEGLACLWTVRRFDTHLLGQLIGSGQDERAVQRVTERLLGYAFVREHGQAADRFYTVHDFVRDRGMATLEPIRRDRLHRLAATYYRGATSQYLSDYEGWFRYEDPRWQGLVREWLYHVAHLEDAGRSAARAGLARLFMDAFWWWGHYVPFEFCDQLLADWADMVGSGGRGAGTHENMAPEVDADAVLGRELHELYVRFPKTWREKYAPIAEWLAVRDCTTRLWELLQADTDGSPQIRHVEGLLLICKARSLSRIDSKDPEAAVSLDQARELFEGDGDTWNVAWVDFLRGELALDQGDTDTAVEIFGSVARRLAELEDPELAANLNRACADTAWHRGESSLALDGYARAALHAYHFQIAVGDPEIPPVDEYTQAFLTEMHERTQERIAWLKERGEEELIAQVYTRIRDFFAPYWRSASAPLPRDPADIVRQMFPAPPSAADLHRAGTDYTTTAAGVLDSMSQALTTPPGTPLPQAR